MTTMLAAHARKSEGQQTSSPSVAEMAESTNVQYRQKTPAPPSSSSGDMSRAVAADVRGQEVKSCESIAEANGNSRLAEDQAATVRAQMRVLMLGFHEIVRQV